MTVFTDTEAREIDPGQGVGGLPMFRIYEKDMEPPGGTTESLDTDDVRFLDTGLPFDRITEDP